MNMLHVMQSLGIGISLALGVSTVYAGANTTLDTSRVFRKWADREKKITTLRFEWDNIVSISAKSRRSGNRTVYPENDVSFHSMETLTLRGDWMRLETRGLGYSEKDNTYVKNHYISTYNGSSSKAFYDLGGTGWRAGFILKREDNQDCSNYHMRPMKLFARPVSPKFTFFKQPEKWSYGGDERAIRGRKCSALTKGSSSIKEAYWIDPSKDDNVVMYEQTANGKMLLVQEIQYAPDLTYGYVPSGWTTTRCKGDNVIVEGNNVTVKRFEIGKDYSKSEFDVQFPEGTEVRDDIDRRFYLLEKDGRKRDVLREPGSGERGEARPGRGNQRLLGMTTASLLIAVGLLALYRASKNRTPFNSKD